MTASINNSDVSDKTSLTRSYAGTDGNSATRSFVVTGLDTDNQDNSDAINAVKTSVGDYHHSITNLPVAAISASKFGPDRANVRVTYRRSPISIPSVRADLLAREATGLTYLNYYSSDLIRGTDGRPAGPVDAWPPVRKTARSQSYPVATRRITVATILDHDPAETVEPLNNTCNTHAVTLAGCFSGGSSSSDGGFEFPVYSLAFWGHSVSPVDMGGSVLYRVMYNFEYCPGGWVEQRLDPWDISYGTPPVISTSGDAFENYRFSYVLKTRGWGDFTGVFPAHTPVT